MSDLAPSIIGAVITLGLFCLLWLGGPWGVMALIISRPRIANWLIEKSRKTPYSNIARDGDIYMERFWLFNPYSRGPDGQEASKYKWFPWNIRIHWIRRADSDEHMHDHPWNARTIILRGFYWEVRKVGCGQCDCGCMDEEYLRESGDTAKLGFGEYHRIDKVSPGGAWTLFISGPYQGTWGFLVDGVKIHWKTYLGLK